ncbi:YidB family protein [Rhizobium sp. CBN3]|uniref:YidB family protein n=1 Tax=Rhizobium sp. CBN3 TaxID=3058045 RepID=UPI0026734BF8|nr:YidB family protein [Rhizobium sp. CBN3]MDO3434600.1 YidB family protein [Rhizobium sp. CBN3]
MMSGQMKALLAVLAVAGYQNRDKIRELLRGLQNPRQAGAGGQPSGGLGGILGGLAGSGGLGGLLGGLTSGSIVSGGLGDLLKTFQQNGQGDKMESWVRRGQNADINDGELATALGPDVLDEIARNTGLSHQEILGRLSRDLPKAVDDLTPEGKVPSAEEAFMSSASQATTSGGTSGV